MADPINGGKQPFDPAVNEGRGKRSVETGQTQGAHQETAATQARQATDTTLSDRLQSMLDGIRAEPELDMQRIDELRARIGEGDYPVDAERIAGRMLEFERLLQD